jgi:hypothetical protein
MDRGLSKYRGGRVAQDTYGEKNTNGDQFGADWAEWNIDARHFEDVDRGAMNRGRTPVKQRLRQALRDMIKEEGMERPSRSECEVYRRRRRDQPGL